MDDPLLTPAEVSTLLSVPASTLTQWRYHRKGPPFLKLNGHVRYRRSDLDAWLAERVQPTEHAQPMSS